MVMIDESGAHTAFDAGKESGRVSALEEAAAMCEHLRATEGICLDADYFARRIRDLKTKKSST